MRRRSYPPMRFSVPTGWAVLKNVWVDISREEAGDDFDAYHSEDLLWIVNAGYVPGKGYHLHMKRYHIDLGWYPAADPKGQFRLIVYKDDWDNVVQKFKSRDRYDVRDKLEQWLKQYGNKRR